MSNYEEIDDALSLVKNLSTFEQIQDLLRKRKTPGQKDVLISAGNKDELVDRNLRQAIDARAIKVDEVFELIQSAEENGSQHIFYYKPKTKRIAEAITLESIARQLWGAKWKETVDKFPAIRLRPNQYIRSDFRKYVKWSLRERPDESRDWILKVYGQTSITRFTGQVKSAGANGFWRQYVEEPLRIVLLARWNSPDLLELRVQRNESRNRIEEWHNKLWEMLRPALIPSQFDAWELSKAMTKLILEQTKNSAAYNFRDASVIDQTGVHASFQTYSDQGNLFASNETRDSIENYLQAKSECNGLTVTWLKGLGKPPIPQKDIRTLLGARKSHEIIALANCASEDLDHVADRLRRFNK
jgi:hypothetical protein